MVRDAVSHAPLEGVRLAVAGREGQSGGDGRYRIDSIPAGTHQVSAEAAGYVSGTLDADIRPGIDNLYDVELTATEPAGLRVTTSALPQATVDVPYQASLQAAGGTPPYQWTWGSQGPPGLLLDATGVVTGTPGFPAGTHPLCVTVRDAEGMSASAGYRNRNCGCQRPPCQ